MATKDYAKELVEARKKKKAGYNSSTPSSSSNKDYASGLRKYKLEKQINFDTLDTDLSSLSETIKSAYDGWQTEETMKNTRSSIESMYNRLASYQKYRNNYGITDGDEDVNELVSAYKSTLDSWDDLSSSYGKYKSLEDYNKAIKAADSLAAENEKAKTDDLNSVQSEIDKLKKQYNDAKKIYDNWGVPVVGQLDEEKTKKTGVPQYYNSTKTQKQVEAARDEYMKSKLGGFTLEEFEKMIGEKNAYLNRAKLIQGTYNLSNEAKNAEDLEAYAQKGEEIGLEKNKWYEGLSDNMVAYYRSNPDYMESYEESIDDQNNFTKSAVKSTEGHSEYLLAKYGRDDEYKYYNYHLAKDKENGTNNAEEYLKGIAEVLNARAGQAVAEKYKDKSALSKIAYGYEAGIDQFVTGTKNAFNFTDDYIPTTSTQYASSNIRDSLWDSGFDLPKWLGGSSIGQVAYDAVNTGANMVPSMIAGGVSDVLLPGSGTYVTASLMGLGATGNAYQQMLNQGYNKVQSRTYASLVGLSEATLSAALSGMIGGKVTEKAIETAIKGIDKGFLRFAARWGMNAASEIPEEALQEILEPLIQNIALGYEKNELEDIDWSEVTYAGLLGGISGLGFGGVTAAINTGVEQRTWNATKKAYGESTNELIAQGLESGKDTESYKLAEQAKKKVDSGKELSGAELTRLVEANEGAIRSEIKADAEARLTKLDVTAKKGSKVTSTLAEIIAKKTTGVGLTNAEKDLLQSSPYANRVYNEINSEEIVNYTESMGENEKNLFLSQYDASVNGSIQNYADSFNLSVEYARNKFTKDTILKNKGVLTPSQVNAIYESVVTNANKEKQIALDELAKKHGNKMSVAAVIDDSVIDYNNTTTDGSKVNWNTLNPSQRQSITFMKAFATSKGMNLRLIKNGLEIGINGAFEVSGDTIVLDIYAGMDKITGANLSDTIIPTASHEISHWMKDKSPVLYQSVGDYVFETLMMDGSTEEQILARRRKLMEKAHPGVKYSDEDVRDEVIARACEDMLSMSEEGKKIFDKMSESEKKTFLDKIKEIIQNLMDWVSDLLSQYKSNSPEAKKTREYQDRLETLSKMWDEMLVSSVEVSNALKHEGVTADKISNTTSANGIQEMARDKYWYPQMSNTELAYVRRIAKYELPKTDNYLDENTKWLYNVKNGNTYFALYSTADVNEPTILYACKNTRAEFEHEFLIDEFGEEVDSDERIIERAKTLDKILSNYGYVISGANVGNRNVVGGRSNNRNVGVHSQNSGIRPSEALFDCLRNIREIQKRDEQNRLEQYSDRDTLESRYSELQKEYTQLEKEAEALKQSEEYLNFLDSISLLQGEELDNAIKEYGEWTHKSGLYDKSKRMSEIIGEQKDIRAALDNEKELSRDAYMKSIENLTEKEKMDFVNKAVERFGTTNRVSLASYLMLNGKMLDFSEGQGYRVQDHREISEILDMPDTTGYSDSLIAFMNMGNIRLQTYGIDISQAPNQSQKTALRNIIAQVMRENDEFSVDFSKSNGYTDGSVTYPKGTATTKILSDIDNYFKTGVVPEYESSIAKFRYSDRDYIAYDMTAILKETTIDKYLRDYATKSSPNYAQAYIVYMRPNDFLYLTTSGVGSQMAIENETKEFNREEFEDYTSNEVPIFLRIDHESGEVTSHEGRHRMVALEREGIHDVPVLLFDSSNKYDKSNIDELELTGQFSEWHTAIIRDAIPLSYANRDAVIEKFGTMSKRQILNEKYSIRKTLQYSDRDSAYMEAVNNGDMETAQRLVDEVARENGYRIKGHHGTDIRFTIFDREKTSTSNDFGQGFYFSSSEFEAEQYQKDDAFGDTYNKIDGIAYDNALERIRDMGEDENDDALFTQIYNEEFDKELKRRTDEGVVINAYLKMEKPFIVSSAHWITEEEAIDIAKNTMYVDDVPNDIAISDWTHSIKAYAKQHDGKVDTHHFANNMGHAINLTNALLHQGKYDGILDYTIGKKFNTTSDYHAIALYPNKIKDSSPVTYDDNGNVIPLSERFNAENEDIRYSDRDNISVYDRMGETDRLIKENEQLKEDVERLKERLKIERQVAHERLKLERQVTHGNYFNENQLDAIAGHIRKLANSNYAKKDLVTLINGIYQYIAHSEDLNWQDLFAQCYDVARMVLDEAKPVTETNDYYKMVLKNIRGATISLNEQQIQTAKYRFGNRWRNTFFGKVKIVEDGTSLDRWWQSWSSEFPDLFDAELTDADQLVELYDIFETLKEGSETIIEYDIEERTRWLAKEIYNQYWNVSPIRTTADKYDKQIKRLNYEHRKAMQKVRDDYNARLTKQKQRDKAHFQETYRKLRERKDKEIAEVRELGKKRMDAYKDRAERKTKIQSITSNALTLNKWLVKNSKDEHIHEAMKGPVIALLNAIDFSSKQLLGMEGTVIEKRGTPTKNDISLSKALSKVKDMMYDASVGKEELVMLYGHDLNDDIKALVESVDNMMSAMGDNEFVLNKMSLDELNTLDKIVTTIRHSVTKMNKFHTVNHAKGIANLSQEEIAYADKLGKTKVFDPATMKAKVRKLLSWDNSVPYYAFKRFGEAGQKIFEAFQDGWDKLSFHAKEIIDFAKETYTEKEIKEWSKDVKSFDILMPTTNADLATPNFKPQYQKVQMSVPQIMSLYCLSKRKQAKGHILGGGIRVADIKLKNGELIQQSEGAVLTEGDITKITSTLTDRQKQVADALQEFMNTVCSDWGNEVSMARFGYLAFGEKNYFPIQSDNNNLPVPDETQRSNDLFKLLNMSFTKSLTEDADNRIVISDIFDVFAQHSSDMAKYNALALPVLDAFRWYNYKEKAQQGDTQFITKSVKQSIENAFGKEGQNYITTFLKDINGQKNVGRDTIGKGFFSNAKIASVAANLRVALLQPTAFLKAGAVMKNKYLTKAFLHKPKIKYAEKYCGMALWKSLGYYDTDISKGLTEKIKHDETWKDKAVEISLKGAEWGDKITFGYLWNACELEIRDTRKDLKVGSDEFFNAVGKRLREVIYATQVVDSTMTRSQIMRSGNMYEKMLTAFSSEPTLAYNMLQDVYIQGKLEKRANGKMSKETLKKFGKVFTAYTVTNVIAALIESGFDAFRDDDDEEMDMIEFMKLYLGNFYADMSVIAKIPYLKEIISIAQGFTSSRSDTQWMQSFSYAIKGLYKIIAEGEGDPAKTIKNSLMAISYVSGLPFYNVYRDLMATLDKLEIFTSEDLEEIFADLF